jgi:hypothetical protein
VEFALVLPMLLVLLLGIADLGRVFAAGIAMEATARNAAEAAAQEYVQLQRNKPGGALDAADYERLHDLALRTVCSEATVLPNSTPQQVQAALNSDDAADDPSGPVDTARCPDWTSVDGTFHPGMPVVATCVHDDSAGDAANCGGPALSHTVPGGCSSISGWSSEPADASNHAPIPDGSLRPALPYVEVRICYHFTTLLGLHMALPFGNGISIGDIWLQRDRNFVGGDY